MTTEIRLRKFDVARQLNPSSKIAIFGKPGTGKTNLMYDIAMKLRDKFPVVNIFNGSELENRAYEGTVPATAISSEFDEGRLSKIIQRQRMLKKRGHKNPWAMTIIDDCADNPKFFKTNLFRRIFKLGRHYAHLIAFLFQDALDLPRDMRNSLDYIFILKENSPKSRDLLAKNYITFFTRKKQVNQLLDQCTNDYRCIVIDCRSNSTKVEDIYYWYKADMIDKEEIKLGSEQFWDECTKHYNADYDDEEELMAE